MSKRRKVKPPVVSSVRAEPSKRPFSPIVLGAVLVLALAVRIVYLFLSKDTPFYEPLILYPSYSHKWALRILSGDLMGEGVFYGLPLYPFFLAFIYKLSNQSLVAVKLVQACLGVGRVLLAYKIGFKIYSRAAGVLAAIFTACYGPLFFHEQILTSESLSVPLYALSFYLVCLFLDRPTIKKGLVLGVCAALAALTKAGIIPFV